jgi:hypothetical protein
VRHLTDPRSEWRAHANQMSNAKHPPHHLTVDGCHIPMLEPGCRSLWSPLRLFKRRSSTLHRDAQRHYHYSTACTQVNSLCRFCNGCCKALKAAGRQRIRLWMRPESQDSSHGVGSDRAQSFRMTVRSQHRANGLCPAIRTWPLGHILVRADVAGCALWPGHSALIGGRPHGVISRVDGRAASLQRVGPRGAAIVTQRTEHRIRRCPSTGVSSGPVSARRTDPCRGWS